MCHSWREARHHGTYQHPSEATGQPGHDVLRTGNMMALMFDQSCQSIAKQSGSFCGLTWPCLSVLLCSPLELLSAASCKPL